MKSVQIRGNFWSVFSAFGLNTERYFLFSPNDEKYGPEITPYLDTFHAVEEKENGLNNLLNAR